jgi:hypothetical protein
MFTVLEILGTDAIIHTKIHQPNYFSTVKLFVLSFKFKPKKLGGAIVA